MVDGLLAAWAEFGMGRMSAALDRFDAVAETPGGGLIAYYNKALALARVGDFEDRGRDPVGPRPWQLQLDRRGHDGPCPDPEPASNATTRRSPCWPTVSGNASLDADARSPADTARSRRDPAVHGLPDAAAGAAEVFYVVAGVITGDTTPGPRCCTAARRNICAPIISRRSCSRPRCSSS
jgi:hypothetical protein